MNPEYRGTIYADLALLKALREFVSYGMCRQANQRERDMLAKRFAQLAEQHKPLLTSRGIDPSQMSDVEFDELSQVWLSPGRRSATARKANAARARRGEPQRVPVLSRPKASRRK